MRSRSPGPSTRKRSKWSGRASMRTRSSSTRSSTRSSRRESTAAAARKTSCTGDSGGLYPTLFIQVLRSRDNAPRSTLADEAPTVPSGRIVLLHDRPRDPLHVGVPRPAVLVLQPDGRSQPRHRFLRLGDLHGRPLQRRRLEPDDDPAVLVARVLVLGDG